MKEAFWGVLIITLGLFGIVVVNLFQNITVDNDRTYYVIKEAAEGAVFDAIDLGYYRLNARIRIVEDKFVENLTRRFAENITNGNYKIVVEDVNEMPPKISLRVETKVGVLNTALLGKEDPFNIVNRVDAIIESNYDKEELKDIIIPDPPTTDNVCPSITTDEDNECINGDMMYMGDEDITIQNKVCTGTTPPSNVSKKVNYKVCECGKWVNKQETLVASPTKNGSLWTYTWVFYKDGKNRVINEVIKENVLELQCTDGIQIMVPDDIEEKNQNNVTIPYQPSSDNSRYEICSSGGIKIPLGMSFVVHPNYIPPNSVNRNLIWGTSDSSILRINAKNPTKYCELNSKNSNCFSVATITANKLGTTYINVETTQIDGVTRRGQTATCKVEVYDGQVDSVACKNINLEVGKTSVVDVTYKPLNATKKNYTFSVADTTIATISGNNITAKAGGKTTITVKETNSGKTGTCTITVPSPPPPPPTYPDNDYTTSSSTTSGYWRIIYPDGTWDTAKSYEEVKKMVKGNGENTILYKTGDNPEIKYSEVTMQGNTNEGTIYEEIYNGNKDKQSTVTVISNIYGKRIITTDKNGKTTIEFVSSGYYVETEVVKPGSSSNGSGSTTTGKPNGNGACLDGDTKILTSNGYKNISDLKVGDLVLSYNSKTKENEYKEVTVFYKHINMKDVLYTIVVNNKIIKATRLHSVFVKTKDGYEYKKVEDLQIGDLLMDSKGNYHPIRRITSKFMLSDYYDIEVKDNHNYYVGRDNILVHNAINTKSNN